MPTNTSDHFEVVEIATDIFALQRNEDDSIYAGYGVNQAFIVLEDSVLLFDSGFTLLQAKTLELAVKNVTDKKIHYLINSHDHSDHVFGNSYFHKKYSTTGLQTIAHANCASILRSLGTSRMMAYRKVDKKLLSLLSGLAINLPNVTYEQAIRLEIEGTQIVLVHPASGAHTLGDTLLAIPSKGVMMTGDILVNSFFPNIRDSNLGSWIDFLRDIDLTTYKKFVPGHGQVCDGTTVEVFREYLQTVCDRLLACTARDSDSLRACFELEMTDAWKFRTAVDKNIEALTGKMNLLKNLK